MNRPLEILLRKRSKFWVHVVVVTLAVISTLIPVHSAELAPTFSDALSEEKISPELLSKLRTSRAVAANSESMYRVIVSLQDTPEISQESVKIQATQASVIDALSTATKGFKELYRYESIAGFSAHVTLTAIAELVAHNAVAYIEEMIVFEKQDAQAHAITNTPAAHAISATGTGVTIAIIDDGIQYNHPAFGGHGSFPNGKILGGYDFADNDSNPGNDCAAQSHGTQVAGVAAGNGAGVLGTAPDAKIVFLKIQSSGICGSTSLNGDIIAAIDWAVTNQATYNIKVLSMSFGGGQFFSSCDNASSAYTNVLAAAKNAGITAIAASGNNGFSSSLAIPACVSTVTSVGATYDANLGFAGFSNCSDPTTQAKQVTCYSNSANFLDLLAPSNCATTSNTGSTVASCFGGTSSATPYAAGIAATLHSVNSTLDDTDVINIMKSTGEPVIDTKNNMSFPFVQHLSAVQAAAPSLCTICEPKVLAPVNGEVLEANQPIDLLFEPVPNAERYHVLVYDKHIRRWGFSMAWVSPNICSSSVCTLQVPGLNAQFNTIWKVRAFINGSWTEYSDDGVFSAAYSTPPAAPTTISPSGGAVVDANTPVVLSFREVLGAARYHVLVFDKTKQRWGYSNAQIPPSVCVNTLCRIQVPRLPSQDRTLWKVRAFNTAGWGAYSSNAVFTVKNANSAPAKPQPIAPSAGQTVAANTPIVLSFREVPSAVRYHVLVFDKTIKRWGYSNAQVSPSVCVNTICRIQVTGLPEQNRTLWKVRGFNRDGWGEYSLNAIFNTN